MRRLASRSGQALPLLIGALAAALAGAALLAAVAGGIAAAGREQRAADLGALAAARAMRAAFPRLFEPVRVRGARNPAHLELAAYLGLGRRAALRVAALNGARRVAVSFPDADPVAPVRVRVVVLDPVRLRVGGFERAVTPRAIAEAELVPPGGAPTGAVGGGYAGPLAHRQGRPMRPDVAAAFDRMERAARADGVALTIASGFRSDAEQAVLWARHPDPRWVARPGRSLHRLATELDLGPRAAWPWLAANAGRFHFRLRYSWEKWHYGYELNAGSGSVGYRAAPDGGAGGAVPDFVPARFAPALARAAQRWNVSAALLAAQIAAESGFNPFAVSGAGARGIAQFVPGTARAYGLRDPFDPAAAIDAQARMMRDLLRRFAAVPLALAAYNAGAARVAACGCVPAIPETRAYVARILGMLGGAGDPAGAAGLTVRLVR